MFYFNYVYKNEVIGTCSLINKQYKYALFQATRNEDLSGIFLFFSFFFFFFSFRDELLSDHGISSEENEVIEPKRKSPRSFGRSQRVKPVIANI